MTRCLFTRGSQRLETIAFYGCYGALVPGNGRGNMRLEFVPYVLGIVIGQGRQHTNTLELRLSYLCEFKLRSGLGKSW